MELLLARSQAERGGRLGGRTRMSFRLRLRLNLSAQEGALIEKYDLQDRFFVADSDAVDSFQKVKGYTGVHRVSEMVGGQDWESDDVTMLLRLEEAVKEACRKLRYRLDLMDSFGGEEVVDFAAATRGSNAR